MGKGDKRVRWLQFSPSLSPAGSLSCVRGARATTRGPSSLQRVLQPLRQGPQRWPPALVRSASSFQGGESDWASWRQVTWPPCSLWEQWRLMRQREAILGPSLAIPFLVALLESLRAVGRTSVLKPLAGHLLGVPTPAPAPPRLSGHSLLCSVSSQVRQPLMPPGVTAFSWGTKSPPVENQCHWPSGTTCLPSPMSTPPPPWRVSKGALIA